MPFKDGYHVMTGDSTGQLKTWDLRTGACLHAFLNEPKRTPISNISSYTRHGGIPLFTPFYQVLIEVDDDEARFFAVNSYDNGTIKSSFTLYVND
jgi:COMPASS component SWD3